MRMCNQQLFLKSPILLREQMIFPAWFFCLKKTRVINALKIAKCSIIDFALYTL